MTHALVTIVAPFAAARAAAVEQALAEFGNPASPQLRARFERSGVIHFASAHVVRLPSGPAQLVWEISADGDADAALAALAGALDADLRHVLTLAGLARSGDDPVRVLAPFRHDVGAGLYSVPGLGFAGAPGMSVKRIKDEAALANIVGETLAGLPRGGDAMRKLEAVRAQLRARADLGWAFNREPAPLLEGARGTPLGAAPALLGGVLANLLWPPLALLAALGLLAVWGAHARGGWAFAAGAGVVVLTAGLLTGAALLFVLYRAFRAAETADVPDDSDPSSQTVAAIMAHENQAAQNHLAGVSMMKPGRLRRLTLRVAFLTIGVFASKVYRPGQLGGIGSIHFARWILLPGTDALLFLSNYDGSWESYLEDFIEQAHAGLTAVWSNTLGFPKTSNLFQDGATDGDRFKRWARRQQQPTLFWYSAYPTLTMSRIRVNAAIRQGLAAISTREAATDWLACFGSAPAPASVVEAQEVQTLIFGGMARTPYAVCLVGRFDGGAARARQWLAQIEPSITFGLAPREADARVVAFTANGLASLGLPESGLDTLPAAYRHGMSAPWRARLLGDVGANDPAHWRWGGTDAPIDVAVLLYAQTLERLNDGIEAERQRLQTLGHTLVRVVRTAKLPPPEETSPEPFGFEDGLSQPIIRGLRAVPAGAEDHAVAPGEFLLGYPDNRGNMPPTLRVAGRDDPEFRLPAISTDPMRQRPQFVQAQPGADRDLGCNGAFLVIRQLEQDVQGFAGAMRRAADALDPSSRPALDPALLPEWFGAKIVGRWKNGNSLVNHPGAPGKADEDGDNKFRFGEQDADGRRCPFGAHIRRANPRDAFAPGSDDQVAISNRHRILRVGRPYAPEQEGQDPGLLFICLNADIQRQFEFLQQSWILGPSFQGLQDEADPLMGAGDGVSGRFTIPTDDGPLSIDGFKDFVTTRGGGYFFMPSRSAIAYLASDVAKAAAASLAS